MQNRTLPFLCFSFITLCLAHADETETQSAPTSAKPSTLNILFVGNSYTARHNLATVVKQLAEAGDPNLTFNPTQVIYGGRTLKDHWRLGTQHIVNQHQVTAEDVQATIDSLQAAIKENAKDKYAPRGLQRMKTLLKEIQSDQVDRTQWDWVVLQSYRDDLKGDDSLYMQYAPRFVKLAKSQGAKVLLYETTPTTQNQFPMAQYPDAAPVIEKSKSIARLAKRLDVHVAPMSYVAQQCQYGDDQMPLRFINDAHLNQNMAYLTACTIYAAMFDRSPEGLDVNSVTDIRYWKDDRSTKKDRDEKPITKVFSGKEQNFLQTTAWKAFQDFKTKF
jgi:ribosomal protein S15P/S13E